MTEVFSVSHSQLTLWCNGYDAWLLVRGLGIETLEESFFVISLVWLDELSKSEPKKAQLSSLRYASGNSCLIADQPKSFPDFFVYLRSYYFVHMSH